MDFEHDFSEKSGAFIAKVQEKQAGLMSYIWAGTGKFIIDHTEVSEEFRGQKVGQKLLAEAVEFARQKGVKILPLCPFAKAMFDKDDKIKDVLFQ